MYNGNTILFRNGYYCNAVRSFLKMRKTMKKIACWRKYDFYESKIPSPIHPVPSFKKFVCITLEVMHHKQRHMLSIVFTLVKLIYLCIPCPIQRNKNDELTHNRNKMRYQRSIKRDDYKNKQCDIKIYRFIISDLYKYLIYICRCT